jgi:hypothetical protein
MHGATALAMRRRVEDRRAEHSDRAAASLGGGSVLRAFISKAPAPRPTGVDPRAHNHLTTLALASTQRPRTHRRYHPPPRIACYAGVRPRTSATGATGERTQSCTDLRRAQANVSHALPSKSVAFAHRRCHEHYLLRGSRETARRGSRRTG